MPRMLMMSGDGSAHVSVTNGTNNQRRTRILEVRKRRKSKMRDVCVREHEYSSNNVLCLKPRLNELAVSLGRRPSFRESQNGDHRSSSWNRENRRNKSITLGEWLHLHFINIANELCTSNLLDPSIRDYFGLTAKVFTQSLSICGAALLLFCA
eukprot:gb/GECG01004919.1/.p1 GENE.gb/GECG01004919.1/~~gb/GECG01004919.1/.p1  ORF type:complete len:153 (+),score=11.99 gb/GECG01004919.1/:1-459(+)